MPALVREADDRDTLLLGLVENVAREDLSPVEEARAYAVLIDEFGLSLGEVAERVGTLEAGGLEPLRLLELSGRRARDGRARRADRGPRARGARRAGPRGPAPARAQDRPPGAVGARRRARGALGRREGEAQRQAPADPALAERVRRAAES